MKKIADVMTQNPTCVSMDATLMDVAKLMAKEDTGFIPVCQNDELKGVITDRDIVLRAVAQGKDLHTAKASEVLSATLVCVTPQQDAKDGVHMMEEHQVRRLCVVESQGSKKIIGVVSLGDLAEIPETQQLSEEALQQISRSMKTLAHAH